MAKVIESKDKLILQLSFWERIGALHKSLTIDKSSLIEKKWQINLGATRS